MDKRPTIYLYLHTHWDREWYQPFDTYRASLMAVVRDIAAKLEDDELPNFLLDGQSCVLEDVAEIDPSLMPRLKALMKKGVLAAGPWYVLADQMLVCGESLVRNLKMGLAVTKQYGPPALVGYCPDTFGHTADLPRILTGFGIDNAFVWRGVPPLDNGPLFFWQSACGSRVLCYHLAKGYYQPGLHLARNEDELVKFLSLWIDADATRDDAASVAYSTVLNGSLAPVGADHMAAPAAFNGKLRQARAAIKAARGKDGFKKEPHLVPITLPDFAALLSSKVDGKGDALARINGELRDNEAALLYERAYMLPGVLSTRLYLKKENRLAEHRILRLSEPLYTLLALSGSMNYPLAELQYAWRLLLRNQPHDSICGCSVDAVHDEMMQRTKGLHNLLDGLDLQAAQAIFAAGKQAISSRFATVNQPVSEPLDAADVLSATNLSAQGMVGPIPITWAQELSDVDLLPVLEDPDRTDLQVTSRHNETLIFTGFGQEPSVREVEVFTGWAWLDHLPALSTKETNWRLAPVLGRRCLAVRDLVRKHELVSCGERRIANEFLAVEIDPQGMLYVTKTESRKRSRTYKIGHGFRDVGDGGDTYNFDPLEGDRPVTATLKSVHTLDRGPLVASLQLEYEISIPLGLEEPSYGQRDDDKPPAFRRSTQEEMHLLTTKVSLRRGVPLVFFETKWENHSADHRLEVVFDTGLSVEETWAENHFSLVKRSKPNKQQLPAPKGEEAVLDRLACQRFFIANGQLFLNMGLPEYAIDGSCVSMTILRAVSYLSRQRLRTRGGGAGPPVLTPKANCMGANHVAYAWAPLGSSRHEALASREEGELNSDLRIQAYRLAELFEGNVRAFWRKGEFNLESCRPLIQIDNPAIRVSAIYCDDEARCVFVRLLNVTGDEAKCLLTTRIAMASASLCNLGGRSKRKLFVADEKSRLKTKDVSFNVQLGAYELITVALNRAEEVGKIDKRI
jgi:alpha-mannosidase